jgi:hypothetical protein
VGVDAIVDGMEDALLICNFPPFYGGTASGYSNALQLSCLLQHLAVISLYIRHRDQIKYLVC